MLKKVQYSLKNGKMLPPGNYSANLSNILQKLQLELEIFNAYRTIYQW